MIKIKFYKCKTKVELSKLHTKQLLNHLRNTYSWGDYEWEDKDYKARDEYQELIKSILATREHVPTKKESKALRKAKIKKGI